MQRKLILRNLVTLSASSFLITSVVNATSIKQDTRWAGSYLGANAGYSWGQTELETLSANHSVANVNADHPSGTGTIDSNGFTGGVQAGYNWRNGALLLGIELDFNSFNTESTREWDSYTSSVDQSMETDWLFTARPRMGYANDNMLLYVTGGLAVTRVEIQSNLGGYYDNDTISGSETRAGWIFGGGAEFLVAENLSVKAEYLYANFGTFDTVGSTSYIDDSLFSYSVNPRANIVRTGINYYF